MPFPAEGPARPDDITVAAATAIHLARTDALRHHGEAAIAAARMACARVALEGAWKHATSSRWWPPRNPRGCFRG